VAEEGKITEALAFGSQINRLGESNDSSKRSGNFAIYCENRADKFKVIKTNT